MTTTTTTTNDKLVELSNYSPTIKNTVKTLPTLSQMMAWKKIMFRHSRNTTTTKKR